MIPILYLLLSGLVIARFRAALLLSALYGGYVLWTTSLVAEQAGMRYDALMVGLAAVVPSLVYYAIMILYKENPYLKFVAMVICIPIVTFAPGIFLRPGP